MARKTRIKLLRGSRWDIAGSSEKLEQGEVVLDTTDGYLIAGSTDGVFAKNSSSIVKAREVVGYANDSSNLSNSTITSLNYKKYSLRYNPLYDETDLLSQGMNLSVDSNRNVSVIASDFVKIRSSNRGVNISSGPSGSESAVISLDHQSGNISLNASGNISVNGTVNGNTSLSSDGRVLSIGTIELNNSSGQKSINVNSIHGDSNSDLSVSSEQDLYLNAYDTVYINGETEISSDGKTLSTSEVNSAGVNTTNLKVDTITNNSAGNVSISSDSGYVVLNGNTVIANDGKSLSIGDVKIDTANNAILVGTGASDELGVDSISIGNNASSQGWSSTAIGNNASSYGMFSVALGGDTIASAFSIALGELSVATGEWSCAVGRGANAINVSACAIGNNASASGGNSISLGSYSVSSGTDSVAVGNGANAYGCNSLSFGNNSIASGNMSIAVGNNSKATMEYACAVGNGANASNMSSIAIGHNSRASGIGAISIGGGSARDAHSISLIGGARNGSISIGDGSYAFGVKSVSIGSHYISSVGNNSIAIGTKDESSTYSIINASSAIVIGCGSSIVGSSENEPITNSMAIGTNATATGNDSIAIGNDSHATGVGSIQIGAGTNSKDSTLKYGNVSIDVGGNISISSGDYISAIGFASNKIKLKSDYGVEIGDVSTSAGGGTDSIAIGSGAKTTTTLLPKSGQLAIGTNSKVSSENSTAIGNGATVSVDNTIVLGNSRISSLRCQVQTISALSDSRVKEEISQANTSMCLDDVNRLAVSRFKYKDFTGYHQDIHRTGFLADDVEVVFPKSVSKNDEYFPELDENGDQVYEEVTKEDGTVEKVEKKFLIKDVKHIAMEMAIPTLWGAVQELSKQLEEAKNEIRELKDKK